MEFTCKIFDLDKSNLNGRAYSQECIQELVNDPSIIELNKNKAIPIYSHFNEDSLKWEELIGTCNIDVIEANTLNLKGNISDSFIENIQDKYLCPAGYANKYHEENLEDDSICVIDDYTLDCFFLSDTTAFKGLDNCKIIPVIN